MGILIKKAFAQLLFWLYEFLDAVFEMFQILCGIAPVEYTENGETVSRSIVEVFLRSSTVTKAFLLLFLIAIIVCAFSVIAAVVKNVINMKGGERKSHAKTLGQGFGSIIVTLVMAVIMLLGINGSNALLGSVYEATIGNKEVASISAVLFNMSVSESYKYDMSTPLTRRIQATDENGNLLWEGLDGKPTIKEKEAKKDVQTGEPVKIWTQETYYDFLTVKDSDGKDMLDVNGRKIYVKETGWHTKPDGTLYSAADIKFSDITVDVVFGERHRNLIGVEKEDSGYLRQPMVELDSFNIFTAYFVVILVIIALVWSMLGLVKRVFDLVMLFMMLPLISATIPLDDGARLKTWRDTVVSKVILAYGAVLSVNVFIMLVPMINGMNLGLPSAFSENLFKMFMLIGGALCINGGQLLISRLFGTSAEESREMAQSARALVGGIVAAGGLAHSVKNGIFGGKSKYGVERKGLLKGGKEVAGKATNIAGNVLGGQAYRSMASKAMGAAGGVKDAISGIASYKRPNSSGGMLAAQGQNAQAGSANLALSGGNSGEGNQGENGTSNTSPQSKRNGLFKNGLIGAAGKGVKGAVNAGKGFVDTARTFHQFSKMFASPLSRAKKKPNSPKKRK